MPRSSWLAKTGPISKNNFRTQRLPLVSARPVKLEMQLSSETCVETVLNFGRWFRLTHGRVDRLAGEAAHRGRRWLQGVSRSWAAFA